MVQLAGIANRCGSQGILRLLQRSKPRPLHVMGHRIDQMKSAEASSISGFSKQLTDAEPQAKSSRLTASADHRALGASGTSVGSTVTHTHGNVTGGILTALPGCAACSAG
jgi:hypothetical protein